MRKEFLRRYFGQICEKIKTDLAEYKIARKLLEFKHIYWWLGDRVEDPYMTYEKRSTLKDFPMVIFQFAELTHKKILVGICKR